MNYFAKVIKLDDNISKSKNRALKEALNSPYNDFFLIESCVEIKNNTIFEKFIETNRKTGINCLMWPECIPNKQIEFREDPYINYWADFAPCFTYYTRESIKKVGLFDEDMPSNTWQEVEHAKRIGDAGLSTPFGMFASPKNIVGLEVTEDRGKYINRVKMEEGLIYWENKDQEDFPIKVKKQKDLEMI